MLHFKRLAGTLPEIKEGFFMKHKYSRIFLKPGREVSLLRGHPWIFSGAVARVEGQPEPGDIAVAVTHEGVPLAVGFYNPRPDIAFRQLTMDPDESIDAHFWQRRIQAAMDLRKKVVPEGTTAYRLINAEGDGIPGLIVDRYNDYLVISITTAGVERLRQTFLHILSDELKPEGIYERSDGRSRKLEGLEDRIGCAQGIMAEALEMNENGLLFKVDVVAGQKTGFFLDQRPNRERVEKLSRGAAVLNCFSYTGAFSVYSARGGALRAISVEASESANDAARCNLQRNGFSPDQHPVIRADVFAYLRETEELFDLIILDPPAFAKSRKDVARSARGYKDINLQAARRLKEGGILATFSCSNYVDELLFQKIVLGAVCDAGKMARVLEILGPGADHPTNLAHPEGRYLKGLLLYISC